ncbi:hypothetical protein QFC19_008085 [Naganishia cerealis]|uniref:Uncharacterized protein n=1 Tax=Naganishia cerealis TaxID=610337 RepID=A0ACC2V458_9TREE|nr:hypothetical protein QFC19_008085 [Naganishia cerealis]
MKGEQIVVTENKTAQPSPRRTSSQEQRDIPAEDNQGGSDTVPPPLFETAPTPRSTISTATHTPTPAPSVPRTIIPSPITYNYPGTGPASAASTTSVSALPNHSANLAVPFSAKGGFIGSSPLAEKNHGGLSNGLASKENSGHSGDVAAQPLGDQNDLTPLSDSGKPDYVDLNDGMGSVLIHRVVPDDNSCLFSAIGLVFKGHYDSTITRELRKGRSDSSD